jgi:hypothetical protein
MGGKAVTFVADDGTVSRVCYVCGEEKSIDDFSGKEYRCILCNRQRNNLRDAEYRAKLRKIKLDSGCADCGYNAHVAPLQFDHLPGFKKLFSIGAKAQAYSWDKVMTEIAKCEVVCANCHFIRTWDRRKESDDA